MPSIPSSPNVEPPSSASSNQYYASNGTSSSRRSSRTSQTSIPYFPTTPRHSLGKRDSASLSIASDGLYGELGEGEDMDNLADELADAWDENGEEEPGSSFLDGLREGSAEPLSLHDEICSGNNVGSPEFHSVRSPTTPLRKPVVDDPLGSPTRSAGNIRRSTSLQHREDESRCMGSNYADDSDLEEAKVISPALARQMTNIEALARQCLNDDSVSEAGGVVLRTTLALQDLGPQSSIENGVTRMTTAYTSIAMHRTQKTREIYSVAHSLLLDRYPNLAEEDIGGLIAELDILLEYLQLPSGPSPLQSLHSLIAGTADLAHSLRSLTDMIQESKQAASAASRRLKNAKDVVMELQQEEEAREEGIRYLEEGDWDRRIRDREAECLCGDVVAGFETTFDAWRYRLFGTLSTEGTPA
ncbi:hypothetical protein EPUS_03901 [Endocarpon pusillum Z07020]|uniref:Uncharacterized protein n=1 Tax=Endocarpon pusillum (strain Z07020 / HMAS-L-300199) TaxID=1263415 RepID=U1GQ52_ENDPU|nr:uncharacterized protein EPUS_03901 [Endocarpon pusillum Z07020]ERF74463.1 hypothetical protein EPUS_03901 [Endocarpon pusillum Z07020]